MNTTEKPNKIPTPRTIARHFSEGKVCDFPADTVLSAVNAYSYGYNSISIPIQIGFEQMFQANIDAFIYMSQHRTEMEFQRFLSDPNSYMAQVGVQLVTPFDDITPRIIVAMLEDEMFEVILSDDKLAVINLTYDKDPHPWRDRHPERYPAKFMKRCNYLYLNDGTESVRERLEAASISGDLISDLSFIKKFFSAKE